MLYQLKVHQIYYSTKDLMKYNKNMRQKRPVNLDLKIQEIQLEGGDFGEIEPQKFITIV
jgi:hypothetical protein